MKRKIETPPMKQINAILKSKKNKNIIIPKLVIKEAVAFKKLKKKPESASIFSVIIDTISAEFLFLNSL